MDQEALHHALKNKIIAGAALDTYAKEPKREGDPFECNLRELDNVVLCSHLGASTRNAARRTGLEIAEVVTKYLRYGDFVNSVNVGSTVQEEGRDVHSLFITHEDKPGMFGKIDSALGELGVNIRENQSRELKGMVQTVYIIHQKPTDEVVRKLEAIDGIQRVTF